MEIYVIHNPDRKDRQQVLIKELMSQNVVDINFMPAVIASKPAAGISQAHKNCVKWAAKLGLPEICVMEDDVKFTAPDSLFTFFEAYKQAPDDCDIFLAGMYTGSIHRINDHVAKTNSFSGLHCYIVRKKFYDKFLSAPPDKHIDRWIGQTAKTGGNAKVYLSYPMTAIQHNGFSDNVKKTMNYDYLLKKNKYLLHKG